jgi:UDP-2,3-diacylglucosamine hydrolase
LLTLHDNHIIVSDVHFNQARLDFIPFLQKILDEEIITSQLILNGDIFDLLVGVIDYTIDYNKIIIDLLNKLSQKIEIIYLEGNHDFVLQNLFPNIKVYSIKQQPIILNHKNKKVAISHGDIFSGDKFYDIYVSIIRNKIFLKLLNFIDKKIDNKISKSIINNQIIKNKCYKLEDFESTAKNRIEYYKKLNIDIIIEGHHHQDMTINQEKIKYINLPAFVCNKNYVKLDLDD